jgi:hypothetical protein
MHTYRWVNCIFTITRTYSLSIAYAAVLCGGEITHVTHAQKVLSNKVHIARLYTVYCFTGRYIYSDDLGPCQGFQMAERCLLPVTLRQTNIVARVDNNNV